MKTNPLQLITFICLSLISLISTANASDHFAYINCSGKPHISESQYVEAWTMKYNNCTDGESKYSVTFKQHEIVNLDFLYDKEIDPGEQSLLLFCAGTEITGTYGAGVIAGLAAVVKMELGAFVSTINGQSACAVLQGGWGAGAEVSPEILEIKRNK